MIGKTLRLCVVQDRPKRAAAPTKWTAWVECQERGVPHVHHMLFHDYNMEDVD